LDFFQATGFIMFIWLSEKMLKNIRVRIEFGKMGANI
jgi:hypothetical protein